MSPRWPDHSEYMPAVAKLIISLQDEDRDPRLEEVMAVTGIRSKKLAAIVARKAGIDPKRGRPWTPHAEYMPQVLELARARQKRGGTISAAEIQEKLEVGPDLAAALLANLGLDATQYPEDDELLPQARAIIDELGDHWSENQLVERLHIHHRRAKRLAIALGMRPEEIKRGQSAAGNAWWTEKANKARHGKREA
jgi:hypothetical protein